MNPAAPPTMNAAELQDLYDSVARFAREEIAPHVNDWDAAGEFPQALAALGEGEVRITGFEAVVFGGEALAGFVVGQGLEDAVMALAQSGVEGQAEAVVGRNGLGGLAGAGQV